MKHFILILLLMSGASQSFADDKKVEFYGFIKAAAMGSSKGVESNGRDNFIAYSAAANPVVNPHPDHGAMSLQVAQSRFGIKTSFDTDVSGTMEFDFVDFNKSTPTVASLLRLRRAFITYKPVSEWTFNVGQDWDLFSPNAPYSYNYIGHYFLSGDVGFMRLQAQALYKSGDNESAVAIGFPNYNNGVTVNNSEWTSMPTLSARQTFNVGHWAFGGSGIVGHIADVVTDKSITPYAVALSAKRSSERSEFAFESYYGENLENLSLQALSYSANFKHIKEAGGFFTYRDKHEGWGWFTGAGYSHVFNRENMTPSYSYVAGKPTLNLLTTSTGYGILDNATVRVGFEDYLTKKLNFYTEIAHLYTHHLLDAADAGVKPYRSTEVFEVGLKLDL